MTFFLQYGKRPEESLKIAGKRDVSLTLMTFFFLQYGERPEESVSSAALTILLGCSLLSWLFLCRCVWFLITHNPNLLQKIFKSGEEKDRALKLNKDHRLAQVL
jgi:hypothetical protein